MARVSGQQKPFSAAALAQKVREVLG